jgi:hypothetical protein
MKFKVSLIDNVDDIKYTVYVFGREDLDREVRDKLQFLQKGWRLVVLNVGD